MRTPTRKMERWPKLRAETGDGYKDDVTTARCKMVIIMIVVIVMMSPVRLKHVLHCIALPVLYSLRTSLRASLHMYFTSYFTPYCTLY